MARKRMIHIGFFTSATLAAVEVRAMVTYAGLWVYCDDYGRGEDDPTFIAATVWPRRPEITGEEVAADLAALAAGGTLCRYTVGGSAFLHVPSWDEHQSVSHKSAPKTPPCPLCEKPLFTAWWRDDDTGTDKYRKAEKALRAARTSGGETPERLRSDSGETPERLPNDSAQFSLVKSSSVKGTTAEPYRRRSQTAGARA